MILRQLPLISLIAGLFFLQVMFTASLRLLGIQADLLLVFILIWAYLRGAAPGALMGMLCGLLVDVTSSGLFLHTFSYAAIGFLIGALRDNFWGKGIWMMMGLGFFGTAAVRTIEMLLLWGTHKYWVSPFISTLVAGLSNALAAAVLALPCLAVIGEPLDEDDR